MTIYKDIPQPGDQRNVSQVDLLNNNEYLLDVRVPSAPAGILSVDHKTSINNALNPTDGFHKQVSNKIVSTPATMANAVNVQNADGILYTATDGGGTTATPRAVLRYVIGSVIAGATTYINYPISCIQAFGQFLFSNGNVVGNVHNLASPAVRTAIPSPPGIQLDFTFTNPLSSDQYLVIPIVNIQRSGATSNVFYSPNITNLATTGFTVTTVTNAGVFNALYLNVVVIGLF